MRRWLGLLLIACLLCGCEDLIDFFESGFADDGGGGGSGNIDAEDLQGTWMLDLDESTLDNGDLNGNAIIAAPADGTWEVDGNLPSGFLSALNPSTELRIEDADELRIDTQFTFVTDNGNIVLDAQIQETADTTNPDTFTTVRLTNNNIANEPSITVVIRIPSDGREMQMIDINNINDINIVANRGNFTSENERPAIEAYTLVIDADTFTTTVRRNGTDAEPVSQDYMFIEEDDEIDLEEEAINVEVQLTNSNDRLILIFNDGRRGEFTRQGEEAGEEDQ